MTDDAPESGDEPGQSPHERFEELVDHEAVDPETEIFVGVYYNHETGGISSGIAHGETINGRTASIVSSELELMRHHFQSLFGYIRSGQAAADTDDEDVDVDLEGGGRMFQ